MPSDLKLAGLDNPLLPNDVLDDNYARACKYDKMTGVMSIDTSVAMAIISEVREARLAALPASTELSREAQARDAVIFVICTRPDGEQYGIFSTREKAVLWSNAQADPCIIVDHMMVDHPEFGNVASN